MKNTLQKQYENLYLKKHFLGYMTKIMLNRKINSNGECSLWIDRSRMFLHAFIHATTPMKKAPYLSKIHFLLDFSLNSAISNFITSESEGLLFYLNELPGMGTETIEHIKLKQKNFQSFLSLCSEMSILADEIFFTDISEDFKMLIEMNNIDFDDLKMIYLNQKDHSLLTSHLPIYENHFFLEMQLAEDMEDYFTNKRYECLKSLISKETKHFFQSYMNGYKQNYFDFCIENNINLFNFSNEDEEILVDLNFQLA